MKINIGLFTIVASVFFASCTSFLEENPRSERDSENFFQDATDAYSIVNRLYKKGVPERYNHSVWAGTHMMDGGYLSGLFDNTYKGQEVWITHSQTLTLDPTVDNNHLQTMWQSSYEAIIRTANFAINNIPECPGLSEAERNQLIGEAKFFRALNYFYLVKAFGAVPIVTTTYTTIDDLYVKRSTEQKVYDFIVKDLTEALSMGLADKSFPDNGFRISKGSVLALLADVYLNMAGYPIKDESKYALAAEAAESLINNGNYELIQHKDKGENSAYNILRTSDNEKEYLYTIEYEAGIYEGGSRPMCCFPNVAASWGEFKWSDCNNAYQPDPILLSLYDESDDLRFQDHQYFHRSYKQRKGTQELREFGKPLPYFWWEEEAALVTGVSVKDQVHYRLAEMYLIAAEALTRANNRVTAEAIDYLATIKARASINKDKSTIVSELTMSNYSVEQFVQEVWKEKIREFIFEMKIWNDITRTRKYPTLKSGEFTFVDLIGASNPYGHVFNENNIYFPICSQEMQRNPLLSEDPE